MPHTHTRLTAAFLIAALACCLIAAAGRTQTSRATLLRLTVTPAHLTSLNPTVSGDGRRVAFESTADLTGAGGAPGFRTHLAAVSGEAATFVQLAVSRAQAAAVSQDGARVVFASAEELTGANPDRNYEIFLHDGATLSQLTATTPRDATARTLDGNFQPSLSDDGRLVAFSSNRDLVGANPDGNREIFLYDTAARAFTQITNAAGVFGATDAKVGGDGTHVAYIRAAAAQDSADDARRDLILFDRRTNIGRVIAEGAPGLALTPGRAVSDDGSRVVYAAENAAGASQVFLFDGRNEATRQLTSLGTRAADVPLHPTVSGDGSRVAFATRRNVFAGEPAGGVDLFLFDLPTNRLTRVTDAPARATAEVVSSLDDAGSSAAFNFPRVLADLAVSDEFANTSEIFLARLEPRLPFANDLQILHAASLGRSPDKPLAPGQIAIARGTNLSLASARAVPAADKNFPLKLRGAVVTVNSRPARIFFVSPTQINFQIPDETEVGPAQVVVRNHDGYESRAEVRIATAAPGVFTESADGRGAAIALDAANQLRGPFDLSGGTFAAPRRLSIFTTGLRHARAVSVTAAGLDLPVETIVASPDLPGLDEVHVTLPPRLAGAGVVPVVITADGQTGNAATLNFTGSRQPARLVLTPPAASLGLGRNLQFSAAVFDADGFEIAGAHVTFSSSDQSVATVDANGLARGLRVGVATIRASSGEIHAAAELRVGALSLVINEALADPPDGPAGDANRDGTRSSSQDEFVEIVNASDADIDLGGFAIATRAPGGAQTTRHVFAAGSVLPPGTAAVVFGGAVPSAFNPHDPVFGGALISTASTGGLSLLNGGATIALHDPSGALVEELTYGDAGGLDGDRNQSLTRVPDVTGDFAPHLSAAPDSPRAYSPGTKVNGTPFATTAPIARVEINPASASVEVGESQQFDARAFAADGRERRGVIFRWHSSDAAVASIDGSGLARGIKAGTTAVVARARGVESPPAALTIIQPPPRVVRVEVSPAAASVNRGGSLQFTARAFDRDGRIVTDADFSWATGNAAVASVGPDGLARGVGFGRVSLTASTPDGAGGMVGASAALDVLVPLVLNELLADVPPDDPATAAVEGDANRDGSRRSDDDEFVELLNLSNAPVDLSGLRLSDSTSTRFTLPANSVLAAGRAVVIFGGGDAPPDDPAFGGALVLTASALGLNDGGDTLTLTLAVGNEDVTILSQTFGSQGGPPAPANMSLARSPDAEVDTPGGPLIAHASAQRAADRAFSPGTRADGTPFGSPPVTRIAISPPAATLDISASRAFAATAYSDSGGAETQISHVSFQWDVSDASKASPAPATGGTTSLAAHADGTVTLRARAGGREAAATITINPPPPVLTRVELSPPSASLLVGESRQFNARAFDQYGRPLPADSFTFTSSATDRATVDGVSFTPGGTEAAATVSARAAGAAQLTAVATVGTRAVTSNEATVTVNNPPPVVTRVSITPASAALGVGMTRQFTAQAFDQNGQEMSGVVFDWSTSDANVASIDAAGLAAGVNPGAAQIRAASGTVASPPAALTITAPPVPAPGQVILNEALIAFSASAAQTRADFVELYNPTDRTLDISGLVVSFRPGGNTNTVRTITLPGAVGGDTLRIRPRSYFLIINGTQTFGASVSVRDGRPDGFDASRSAVDTVAGVGVTSTCAATSNCFDLNGSSGGVKIEIGGVKLDGLSYQSGATPPAAPFSSYGEGLILIFTSGATNDLIRTPNAADSDNNSADFKRNGSTAAVTPGAANPTLP